MEWRVYSAEPCDPATIQTSARLIEADRLGADVQARTITGEGIYSRALLRVPFCDDMQSITSRQSAGSDPNPPVVGELIFRWMIVILWLVFWGAGRADSPGVAPGSRVPVSCGAGGPGGQWMA